MLSVYDHKSCELKSSSWQGVLDASFYDKVCHWLTAGLWFSPGTPVFSINIVESGVKHHTLEKQLPQELWESMLICTLRE
jgi:hypothetical protein